MIDSDNPVVRLCVDGMTLEHEGRHDEAADQFQLAWERSTNSFKRSVAAHYVARHQKVPHATLSWNQMALEQADTAQESSVRTFYPSLYLNLGKSHEDIGEPLKARRLYECAQRCLDDLPEGPYRSMVAQGVQEGLARVRATKTAEEQRESANACLRLHAGPLVDLLAMSVLPKPILRPSAAVISHHPLD